MGRWRTGTAGLALGVWAALAAGCDGGKTHPPQPDVEDPNGPPEAPLPNGPLPGDTRWTVHTAVAGRQDVVAMAPDGSGGVLVLGTSESASAPATSKDPGGTSLTLARHDGNGQQLWSRSFTAEGEASDVDAPLLAVSTSGDVFLAGRVTGQLRLAESVLTDSAFVAKLAPDGSPLWARAVEPVKALLPDRDGALLVAHGLEVERFDARGTRHWAREMPAMASASLVALDAEGGLVMAGQKPTSPFESQGFIARLSPDGEVRWEQQVGPHAPGFTDVAFRPDGSFLFTGELTGPLTWGKDSLRAPCAQGSCYRTVFVLAADAYGEPLWAQVPDSEEESDAEGARLAMDPEGGAAVLWRHGCGSGLARLSPAGEVRWQSYYVTSPCRANTWLRAATFLPEGDVVGAGMFSGTRAFGSRTLTADGTDVFLQRLVP
ncbi:PQQ-like beta-propeller repeat protein [Pyxidicoccus xibeiensis]|uniref:PQQ-like beta-propeller repeat protein n=1 Tax=Pyxidicoccus xibeiensis TaxID=2906759 RepID=UPI0020A7E7C8|nr:PQQ-like beta-propeller repeat protein [Pyxidicoccus xibeiensis]MCP3139822.1 PQQ-like beta-propeller repeat protein [Pyxidicoccus xibeiensis]